MEFLRTFTEAVHAVSSDVDFDGMSYFEIGKRLGYEFGPSSSNDEVAEFIKQRVIDLIAGTGVKYSDFQAIRKHYAVSVFIKTKPLYKRCFQILEVIRDTARNVKEFTSDVARWEQAITFVLGHLALGRYDPLESLEILYPRHKAIAEALKFMKRAGFKVSFVNGDSVISGEEHKRIAKAIDSRLKRLGRNGVFSVLDNLKAYYDVNQERYFFPRISQSKLVPWGYVYKLSIKHLEAKNNFKCAEKIWKEAIEISTNYITLLEVQEFSKWEFVNPSPDTILKTLTQMVLSDQIYCIEQISSKHILNLLSGIYGQINDSEVSLPWKITDYLSVVGAIVDICKEGTPSLFTASGVHRKLQARIDLADVNTIMESMSRPSVGINLNFLTPFDNLNKDYNYVPLLRAGNGSYMMLDLPLSNFGFYEVISSMIRSNGYSDDEIGSKLEMFIATMLQEAGLEFMAGEQYSLTREQVSQMKSQRADGECDFVLETVDTIIFIEVKKKILTRASQSGNVVKIAVDLVKTCLDAQKQSNWHELVLRKYGKIEFKSGNVLHLNGRHIEKISLSMLDFYSLHDSFLLHKVMQIIVGSELSSKISDKAIQEDLSYVNKTLKVLGTQYKTPDFKVYIQNNNPFSNCRFYNLFHFMELMENVHSVEDLKAEIWKTRSITTGQKDWFMEYGYMKHITSSASLSQNHGQ